MSLVDQPSGPSGPASDSHYGQPDACREPASWTWAKQQLSPPAVPRNWYSSISNCVTGQPHSNLYISLQGADHKSCRMNSASILSYSRARAAKVVPSISWTVPFICPDHWPCWMEQMELECQQTVWREPYWLPLQQNMQTKGWCQSFNDTHTHTKQNPPPNLCIGFPTSDCVNEPGGLQSETQKGSKKVLK